MSKAALMLANFGRRGESDALALTRKMAHLANQRNPVPLPGLNGR